MAWNKQMREAKCFKSILKKKLVFDQYHVLLLFRQQIEISISFLAEVEFPLFLVHFFLNKFHFTVVISNSPLIWKKKMKNKRLIAWRIRFAAHFVFLVFAFCFSCFFCLLPSGFSCRLFHLRNLRNYSSISLIFSFSQFRTDNIWKEDIKKRGKILLKISVRWLSNLQIIYHSHWTTYIIPSSFLFLHSCVLYGWQIIPVF